MNKESKHGVAMNKPLTGKKINRSPLLLLLLSAILLLIVPTQKVLAAQTPSITVITHGYASGAESDNSWVNLMAVAVSDRMGGNVPIYLLKIERDWTGVSVSSSVPGLPIDLKNHQSAIIKVDWSKADAGVSCLTPVLGLTPWLMQIPTEKIADEIVQFLLNNGAALELPIHLIGHSRGGSVMHHVARKLEYRGIWVDQVTSLDPHPIFPCDSYIGEVSSNVIFADNYWRADGGGVDGEPVDGALNNQLSLGIYPVWDFHQNNHTDVHTFYHGTIDTAATSVDGNAIQGYWYGSSVLNKPYRGFYYSRHGGGYLNRWLTSSGLHNQVGGAAARSFTPVATSDSWPNIILEPLTSGNTYAVGETIPVPFYYQDAVNQFDISFSFDDNTNPHDWVSPGSNCANLTPGQISSYSGGLVPSVGIKHATFDLPTDSAVAGIGPCYLRATIKNNYHIRYDYLPDPITITAPIVIAPQITSVSPSVVTNFPKSLTIQGKGLLSTSTLKFSFNGSPTSVAGQMTYIGPNEIKYNLSGGMADGAWTVGVVNGGSNSNVRPFTVSTVVATIAPAAPTALVISPSNWSNTGQFVIDWTNPLGSSGIAKVWWKLGLPPTSSTDGNVVPLPTFKPLPISLPVFEGSMNVYIWLEDAFGNRNQNNYALATLGKDVTPPAVNISPIVSPTSLSSLFLSGGYSDTLSGFASITLSNNGVAMGSARTSGGNSGTWTGPSIALNSGTNVITVSAKDFAGNETSSSVAVVRPDGTSNGNVTVTITPVEAANAGAQWRVNGGVWHNAGEIETGIPLGNRFVEFKVINAWLTPQGNNINVVAGQTTTTSGTYTPVFVNAPPNVPGNPFPANGASNQKRTQFAFSWTGGDPDGPVQYVLDFDTNPNPGVYLGWGDITGTSAQVAFTLQPATTYYWRIKARDSSGAITESPVWRFTTEYSNPDLVVSNVVLNGNVEPGANVTADVTVQNIGNFPSSAGVYTRLYLSRTPGAKKNSLTPYVSYSVPELQPNATYTSSIPVTLNGLQAGQSYIDAWVDSTFVGAIGDSNPNNNTRSIPISYLDGQAPLVTYARLQFGYVKTGIASTITYIATDDTGVRTMDFYYSVDGGITWLPIMEGFVSATPPAYGAAYSWAVPANLPIVSNLKIRVVARDASGNAGELIAGPYVVHDGTAPTVTLLSPNGGEVLPMGSTQQIRWNLTSANAIFGIELYFYHDGTVDCINGTGNGTFSWTLPNNFSTATGKIRIRVRDVNGNIAEDYSDGFFTVRDTSAPPPAPWTIPQAIASVPAPQTIRNVQMATDASGNLHMAYIAQSDTGVSPRIITQTVHYRKRTGSVWSADQIAYSNVQQTDFNMTGFYNLVDLQLAVSNAGTPYMVWGTSYNGNVANNQSDIYFASFDGSNWSTPFNLSADLPGYVGVATSSGKPRIQVDSANAVHVVWTDGNYWNADYTTTGQPSIYYRKKTAAGVWELAIDALNASGIAPAGYPDLSIDNNTLHLSIFGWVYASNSSAVLHSSNNGTGWTSPDVVVNGGVDGGVRIASDSNNHLHMIWRFYNSAVSKSEIYYSYFDGVTWSSKEVISSNPNGYPPTISLDSLNRPHVIWDTFGKLLYSAKNGSQWSMPIQLHYDSQRVDDQSSVAALSALNNEMHVAWVSTVSGASTILYNHANVGSTTDSFPPSVSVIAPVTGANLSVGSSFAIQWSAIDSVGVTNVDLHYSADNGVTWTLIAANQPNSGTYSWVVPAATSLQVRVTVRDAAGNAGAGFSGTATTSDATPPTIVLTAPTSGTPLVGNSTVNVNWTATDNVAVTAIDLDYSLDSGVTWLTMASALSHSGTYAWLTPNSPTSALLIRATAHDAVGYTTTVSMAQPLTIVRANAPPLAPSMPFPLAAGVNVPVLSPMLNWTGGDPDGDALTYQIRFGTTANPPVITTVSNNAYAAGALQYSTQYYWQIVASDGNASTASPVWTFTTENDVTAPTGTIAISSGAAYTNSTSATLTISCTDAGSGCAQMQFSNDNSTWSTAETYTTSKTWTLATGDGTKTVYTKFNDSAGNWSTSYSGTITIDTTAPTTTASPAGGTYNSTQSVTVTCSDETGSGCDKIYYTTDGTTPTTASTVYSTAISISATTTLKFFANDLAGNSETVKTESYIISTSGDTIAPVFSSTAPAANSVINTVTVGYTLSEAVASGKITFAWTGGSVDSASHIYNFTDSDKTVGTHSVNTGLSLVNAGIYMVTFEAADLAGNAATVVSNTGVVFDNTSASVVINSPSSNSRTNSVSVGYTLNEDITSGEIVYTRTGGTSDGLSPHKYTLAVSERTSGSHTINTGVTIIDGAIYTVGFENVTDKGGNATVSVSNTNIMYDSTAVAITNTTPASNAIITNSTVGYTLSEAASSGKVTFTRSGGSSDSGSPHVYRLNGSDLYVGSHSVNTTLSAVNGAFYTVSFDATDFAGNPATTVSNAMVYYDTNYGIGPSGNADNSGYSINRVDGYDLIKLSLAFGSKPGDANWNPICDLDKNGKVDGSDLITLGAHFGEVQ